MGVFVARLWSMGRVELHFVACAGVVYLDRGGMLRQWLSHVDRLATPRLFFHKEARARSTMHLPPSPKARHTSVTVHRFVFVIRAFLPRSQPKGTCTGTAAACGQPRLPPMASNLRPLVLRPTPKLPLPLLLPWISKMKKEEEKRRPRPVVGRRAAAGRGKERGGRGRRRHPAAAAAFRQR